MEVGFPDLYVWLWVPQMASGRFLIQTQGRTLFQPEIWTMPNMPKVCSYTSKSDHFLCVCRRGIILYILGLLLCLSVFSHFLYTFCIVLLEQVRLVFLGKLLLCWENSSEIGAITRKIMGILLFFLLFFCLFETNYFFENWFTLVFHLSLPHTEEVRHALIDGLTKLHCRLGLSWSTTGRTYMKPF